MGGLKTLCLTLALTGPATGTRAEDVLLRHVSECVGRYSAEVEHHWLFQTPGSDPIERKRAHLVDILDALTTPETATQALANRIDAKMAHSALLARAAFSGDPRVATMALRQADRTMRLCSDIALSEPNARPDVTTPARDSADQTVTRTGSPRP